jgi:hypothetical protein
MLFTESHPDAQTVPAELRDLVAVLAWRRCAQEAVVPVKAVIEPPAGIIPDFALPDFVLIERHPLIEA